MITRTTTIGTLKNYRYSLNSSMNNVAYTMNKVMTERCFNSYAEDPALATRCFQMRRSFLRTNTQLTVNESISHKYDVAWQALDSVTTDLYKITGATTADASAKSIITALNDPDASGRNALGQSMLAKAKGIVQTMNSRYGENYVFAGADHLEVPFTWDGVRMNPNYADPDNLDPTSDKDAAAFRYLADPALTGDPNIKYTNNIDEALREPVPNGDYDPSDPDKGGKYMADMDKITPDADGRYEPTTNDETKAAMVEVRNPSYRENTEYKYLKSDGTGTNDIDEADHTALCYRGVPVDSMDAADLEKMDYFVKDEKRYVDVGLGFKEQNGEAVSSTVFDSGLQGVYYLGGYGTEEYTAVVGDGDDAHEVTVTVPNNVITIVERMSEILMNCSPEDGSWASQEEKDEFYALAYKFEDTVSLIGQRYAEMDTEASFLRDNSELLKDTAFSLSEQITELEHVDPADAITEFIYARYVYDAALKVGNTVLSQSLMDYMSF